jgi:hypothetical protein
MFLAPVTLFSTGNGTLEILKSGVALRCLGEAAIGASSFAIASIGLLVFANLDSTANIKVFEMLGFAARLVVGYLQAASISCGGVAHIAVGNILSNFSVKERIHANIAGGCAKIAYTTTIIGNVDHGILKMGAFTVKGIRRAAALI